MCTSRPPMAHFSASFTGGRRPGSRKRRPSQLWEPHFLPISAIFSRVLDHVFYTVHLPIGPHGGPLEIRSGQLFGIGVILFLASVNYLGVRVGGGVQVAVTALKLSLIGGVIVAGLSSSRGNAANFHSRWPPTPADSQDFSWPWSPPCGPMMAGTTPECSARKSSSPKKICRARSFVGTSRDDGYLSADQPDLFLYFERARSRIAANASPPMPCARSWDSLAALP